MSCYKITCATEREAHDVQAEFDAKFIGRTYLTNENKCVCAHLDEPSPLLMSFLSSMKFRGHKISQSPQNIKNTTYMKAHQTLKSHDIQLAPASRNWFKATEYAAIYGIPAPDQSAPKITVGVVSFGGGMYGNVDANGILTSGDCVDYWNYLGIPTENHPIVKIVTIGGATNNPAGYGTDENTLDVQMIGACCPSSKLTIILYIVQNSLANFVTIMDYMLNTAVDVHGTPTKPDIISISWGAAEVYYPRSLLNAINTRFATCVQRGIPVTAATGDFGSNNGVGGSGNYCDFPSSSPNILACGGTRLVSPNYVYDGATVETAWNSGGGAISRYFSKPSYQSGLSGRFRHTPDVSANADPATGVLFLVNGQNVVYGGTSVVSPALAGYFAAIQCKRAVHSLMYAVGHTYYNDIVSGSNGGYNAVVGYDNCTGLGSVKCQSMKMTLVTGNISVSGVSVSPISSTLIVGNTRQLTATVRPSAASNKAVTWASSDTGIVSVSASGLVTAMAAGNATVTVTTTDGGFIASSTIAVTAAPPVLPRSIRLNRTSLTIPIGQTSTLVPTFTPSNTTNKSVTWSSTSSSIASVSSSGVVTGLRRGTTTITVRSVALNSVTARCNVSVR
jgi:hypothetical protein